MGVEGTAGCSSGAQFGKGFYKSRQYRGLCHGNIMCAENEFQLRCQCRESRDRGGVRFEVGFRTIEPDAGWVVGVSGKEQAVGAVEKGDGIRRVARSCNDFKRAASDV